jgi:hypothetical protein
VAAHSTVRALSSAYSGKLYQVRNAAGTTKDISTVSAGGVADSATQDSFCGGTTCIITILYDQTTNGNDVWYNASDSTGAPSTNAQMKGSSATKESITIGGKKVYSLWIDSGNAYWANGANTKAMPTGAAPQGVYMVASGTHASATCCFDYGNSELVRKVGHNGSMDAVNFSKLTTWGSGAGTGPWVMADLEDGLFSSNIGNSKNSNDLSMTTTFVTAVEKNNGTSEFALMGADATTGTLTTFYKGALPNGFSPMAKEGSIVLGSGGDCCATNVNLANGTFYEGAIVAGYPSDATEALIQANVVAAQYAK